ncbi:MAG: hypothetical protein JRI23_13565, partial [Deltaproteobacteria bacterium]|nr:hypothetical protein [Deltaproteobacteria bacterium]MBW2532756.1 hypothetical protein [Deltaproteobacteria bacterium]
MCGSRGFRRRCLALGRPIGAGGIDRRLFGAEADEGLPLFPARRSDRGQRLRGAGRPVWSRYPVFDRLEGGSSGLVGSGGPALDGWLGLCDDGRLGLDRLGLCADGKLGLDRLGLCADGKLGLDRLGLCDDGKLGL